MRIHTFVTVVATTLLVVPGAVATEKKTSDWSTAKGIMGRNFTDPITASKLLRVSYTEPQYRELKEIPFSKTTLEECKGTHMLFPGYPLSLADLSRKSLMKIGLDLKGPSSWLVNQPFATEEKVALRWYLIRMTPVPTAQRWVGAPPNELRSDELIPTAVELVYATVLHYLKTGKRICRLPNVMYTSSTYIFSEANDGDHFTSLAQAFHSKGKSTTLEVFIEESSGQAGLIIAPDWPNPSLNMGVPAHYALAVSRRRDSER